MSHDTARTGRGTIRLLRSNSEGGLQTWDAERRETELSTFLHLHFGLILETLSLKEVLQIDTLNTKFSARSGNASTSSSWRFQSYNSTP